MGAIGYFPSFDDDNEIANVSGSQFGEPDGTRHRLAILEGNGHLIVRVKLQGAKNETDLLLEPDQAEAFCAGVRSVLRRIGLQD